MLHGGGFKRKETKHVRAEEEADEVDVGDRGPGGPPTVLRRAALPGGAPLSDAKVTTQDISFVMRANKGSPELATTGKVRIHDIPITGKSGSETTGDTGDATLVAARIKLTDLLVS